MTTEATDKNRPTTGEASQPLKRVSAYAELHKADWIPANYDGNIYDPAGYDTFVWNLYRPRLMQIVRDLAERNKQLKYLDFACGTGRILAAIEEFTAESVGLDVSPQMIEFARLKTERSALYVGDILEEPEIVDHNFDLITAFRFFLNTEPDMRQLVMRSLARRLAGSESRLIFNVHANGWSVDAAQSLYQRLRGWGVANTMTHPQVARLVEDAGLEIETWYGFGLWPHRMYRGVFGNVARSSDRIAARLHPLRWISHDMMFVCRLRAS